MEKYPFQLVIAVFTGESWGYLGSRRFLTELSEGGSSVQGLKGSLIYQVRLSKSFQLHSDILSTLEEIMELPLNRYWRLALLVWPRVMFFMHTLRNLRYFLSCSNEKGWKIKKILDCRLFL